MRNLAEAFKALSDETRLAMMVLMVRHGELCVCDFVQVMEITQSKASRHLRYLLHAGLVQDRREGVWVHYRVNEGPDQEARSVIEAVQPLLGDLHMTDLERRLAQWQNTKSEASGACTPQTGMNA